MRKIMFDEHFGLQSATIQRRKTKTRRIERIPKEMIEFPNAEYRFGPYKDRVIPVMRYNNGVLVHNTRIYPKYRIGERLAIAQSYKELWEDEYLPTKIEDEVIRMVQERHPGCTNKMYVLAELMPHHIQITDIRIERLQDISDEDCLAEGIIETPLNDHIPGFGKVAYEFKQPVGKRTIYPTPREAFHALINKICGGNTWILNPWATVYSYKRID